MEKSIRPFMVILLILLSIVISSGATYLFVDNESSKEEQNLQSQINDLEKQLTILKNSSTTDETADWKTYTNTVYGFSIKYPNDWKINSSMIDKFSSAEEGLIHNSPYLQIYQGTEENMDNKLELEIFLTDANDLDSKVNLIEPEVKYSELKRTTYNKIKWSIGTVHLLGVEPDPIIGFLAQAWARKKYSGIDNEKIAIDATGYSIEDLTNIQLTNGLGKTFEQIISTFQFTK